jgi:hypothetical protein
MLSAILLMFFFKFPPRSQHPPIPELRQLFIGAASQEASSYRLNTLTENIASDDLPVFVCYKGSSAILSAKYAFGPLSKYRKFAAGKELIERSVKRDTSNVEMRYLRYAIQSNLPSFLGYRDNLTSDRTFLSRNLAHVDDAGLRALIVNALAFNAQ